MPNITITISEETLKKYQKLKGEFGGKGTWSAFFTSAVDKLIEYQDIKPPQISPKKRKVGRPLKKTIAAKEKEIEEVKKQLQATNA